MHHHGLFPTSLPKKPKEVDGPFVDQMSIGTPGPGAYDIPLNTFPSGPAHMIQKKWPDDARPLSANIDYPSSLDFDDHRGSRSCTIGLRGATRFYDDPESPGPSMPLTETLPSTPIFIGKRLEHSPDKEVLPGPGHYGEIFSRSGHVRCSIDMKASKSRRDVIWQPQSDVPGPGAYNPIEQVERPKRWASRLRNIRPITVTQLKRTGAPKKIARSLPKIIL